jgi:hypothetical protein
MSQTDLTDLSFDRLVSDGKEEVRYFDPWRIRGLQVQA